MMPPEPLGPAAVLQSMANALPVHERGDATSDMSTSLDVIALLVHACMVNLGFKLVGFNKDRDIEAECTRHAPHLLARWNRSLSSHGFVYTHEDSSVRFVLHVDRLGGRIEIRGQATGDGHRIRFDISPRDYVVASALPLRITLTPDGEEDRSDLVQKLKGLFVSEDRIKELSTRLKAHLIQQLHATLPEDEATDDMLRRTAPPPQQLRRRAMPEPSRRRLPTQQPGPQGEEHPEQPDPVNPHPYPAPDPLAAPSRNDNNPGPTADFPPPGFDDELEVNRPPRDIPHLLGRHDVGPGSGFGGLGHSDLYPAGLGPDDPIRGAFVGPYGPYSVGPGGLRRPGGGGGRVGGGGGGAFGGPVGGGGGMHPTFDDPIFRGPGARGEGGDDTFGGQIPPGARWDPLGPGGHPRFGGGRGGGGSGLGGGFGGFGGDII